VLYPAELRGLSNDFSQLPPTMKLPMDICVPVGASLGLHRGWDNPGQPHTRPRNLVGTDAGRYPLRLWTGDVAPEENVPPSRSARHMIRAASIWPDKMQQMQTDGSPRMLPSETASQPCHVARLLRLV
jgi:hypothetical protein